MNEQIVNEPELTEMPVARPGTASAPSASQPAAGPGHLPSRRRAVVILGAALAACFSVPLFDLFRFSIHNSLYSHLFVIPLVSAFLAWSPRERSSPDSRRATGVGLTLAGLGVACVLGWAVASLGESVPLRQDRLCLLTLALVLLFAGGCALLLGYGTFRAQMFPIAFLVFMAPMPVFLERWIETGLQHASANASFVLIKWSGMPIFRDGTVFRLPGFSMEVAPECSGIHSTLVLFITALLAGHLFLRHTWSRVTLVAMVLVLGTLRNAVRILILAQLCVRVDPQFINSQLHRNGGPIFFVASLIPLVLIVWILRKVEFRRALKK